MNKSLREYSNVLMEEGNKRLILNQLILIFLLNMMMLYALLVIYSHVVVSGVVNNIYEYNEIDLQHLCDVSLCKYISKDNNTYAKGTPLLTQYTQTIPKISLGDELFITHDFDIGINIDTKEYNGSIIIDKITVFDLFKEYMFEIFIGTFGVNIGIMLMILNINHKIKFRQDNDRESTLYFQSMVMISENLHHELNTPLAVINSKVEKLHKIYNHIAAVSVDFSENEDMDKALFEIITNGIIIDKDFNLIATSLDQIEDILNRMKQFKTLRHHSSNNSLFDVIQATFDVLSVTNPEKFLYKIDADFRKYTLNNDYLQNGEFTNMLLNFAKNSLEANAQSLNVTAGLIKNDTLTAYFADNGNGVEEQHISKMFSKDSSSKGTKRGNGLYINKFILDSSQGGCRLYHTSTEGTIFEIKVRVNDI